MFAGRFPALPISNDVRSGSYRWFWTLVVFGFAALRFCNVLSP